MIPNFRKIDKDVAFVMGRAKCIQDFENYTEWYSMSHALSKLVWDKEFVMKHWHDSFVLPVERNDIAEEKNLVHAWACGWMAQCESFLDQHKQHVGAA